MKMKNIIKRYLLFSLVMAGCFLCIGCGANEEALFVQAKNEMHQDAALENNKVEGMDSSIGWDSEVETISTVEDVGTVEEPLVGESGSVIQKESIECIVVHVCGAVQTPGVYELETESRVMDAVLAAGGFLPEADTEYVNLATVLTDGSKVRIPTKDEVTDMSLEQKAAGDDGVTMPRTQENTGIAPLQKVNINTADKELLCTLPGIGETRAESILAYRAEHGSFSQIEDIMQVSGIKENSFQKIKEYITIK